MKNYLTEDNEIDLFVLLQNWWKFIFKNKWIILIFIALGASFGFYRIKTNPEKYTNYNQSYLMVQSSFISNEILHELLVNLSYQYDGLDQSKYNPKVINAIKEINPVKELSIDGLRSNLRVVVDLREPVDMDELTKLVEDYIQSTRYYELRYSLESKRLNDLIHLINSQLDSIGVITRTDPVQMVAITALTEKKTQFENELTLLNESIEFVAVEPFNKNINTRNRKVLTMLGYSLLSFLIGMILLAIINFIKRLKS